MRLATGSWDETAKVWDLTVETDVVFLIRPGLSRAGPYTTAERAAYEVDVKELMTLAQHRVTAHPSDKNCKYFLHADKCPPFPNLSFW